MIVNTSKWKTTYITWGCKQDSSYVPLFDWVPTDPVSHQKPLVCLFCQYPAIRLLLMHRKLHHVRFQSFVLEEVLVQSVCLQWLQQTHGLHSNVAPVEWGVSVQVDLSAIICPVSGWRAEHHFSLVGRCGFDCDHLPWPQPGHFQLNGLIKQTPGARQQPQPDLVGHLFWKIKDWTPWMFNIWTNGSLQGQ